MRGWKGKQEQRLEERRRCVADGIRWGRGMSVVRQAHARKCSARSIHFFSLPSHPARRALIDLLVTMMSRMAGMNSTMRWLYRIQRGSVISSSPDGN